MEGDYNTKYICNHGMAYSCDIHPNFLVSDSRVLDEHEFSDIKDGNIVYLPTSAIPWFFGVVYPKLKATQTRIVLVTGDSDCSAPVSVLRHQEMFHSVAKEGLILHWFCQNIDLLDCPIVSPVPIGIDYHTIHRKSHWGEPRTHFSEQDIKLDILSKRSKQAWNSRKHMVLLDAHLTAYTNPTDREMAYSVLKDKPFIQLLPKSKPRGEYWEFMNEHRFIVSPLGNGMDCHRTWEALVLGVVPIVRRSTISSLFDGLPVIIVDKYEDITQELLDNYEYPESFPEERLTLKYWNDMIHNTRDTLMDYREECKEDGKTLVCGCVRNMGHRDYEMKMMIDHVKKVLGEENVDFLWVESDSTDSTVEKLNKFTKVISMGKLSDKYPSRTDRIAICRNVHLNYAIKGGYDYMLIMDPDENIFIPKDTKELMTKYVGSSKCGKYAGVFANTNLYYDVWALRSDECPMDCWIEFDLAPGPPTIQKKMTHIGRHQVKISIHDPPKEVKSSFNGMGIYWVPALQGCYYHGKQLIQIKDGIQIRDLCEHVQLNQMLIAHREKLAILPKLYIGNVGKEHIMANYQ